MKLVPILTILKIANFLAFFENVCDFQIFYWTHLLYIPFWILVVIHGPNFWKWLLVPGLIYLCERIYRFSVMSSKRGKTYISSGLLLPSRVTHLVIKRPPHFDFHSGDYVFVNIPVIAHYEWHPFTISSAPEQEGMSRRSNYHIGISISMLTHIAFFCRLHVATYTRCR